MQIPCCKITHVALVWGHWTMWATQVFHPRWVILCNWLIACVIGSLAQSKVGHSSAITCPRCFFIFSPSYFYPTLQFLCYLDYIFILVLGHWFSLGYPWSHQTKTTQFHRRSFLCTKHNFCTSMEILFIGIYLPWILLMQFPSSTEIAVTQTCPKISSLRIPKGELQVWLRERIQAIYKDVWSNGY